jgi:hypothetical protein
MVRVTMTGHQRLVRRFEAAGAKQNGAPLFLHASGKVSRRLPLPFKTRLRLRVTRRVDMTAGWLCGHGMEAAAVGLWRACWLW